MAVKNLPVFSQTIKTIACKNRNIILRKKFIQLDVNYKKRHAKPAPMKYAVLIYATLNSQNQRVLLMAEFVMTILNLLKQTLLMRHAINKSMFSINKLLVSIAYFKQTGVP